MGLKLQLQVIDPSIEAHKKANAAQRETNCTAEAERLRLEDEAIIQEARDVRYVVSGKSRNRRKPHGSETTRRPLQYSEAAKPNK